MSRILEYESRKHRGTRITGRKGDPPTTSKSYRHHSRNERPPDSRTSSINPHTSAKPPYPDRNKLVKENPQIKKGNSLNGKKTATAGAVPAAQGPSPTKIIPVRTKPPNIATDCAPKATNSQSLQKLTFDNSNRKILLVERSKSASPQRLAFLSSTPTTSQISSPSNASGDPRSEFLGKKCSKPQVPPPPPPRIDSALSSEKKSERMLSI